LFEISGVSISESTFSVGIPSQSGSPSGTLTGPTIGQNADLLIFGFACVAGEEGTFSAEIPAGSTMQGQYANANLSAIIYSNILTEPSEIGVTCSFINRQLYVYALMAPSFTIADLAIT